MKVISVAGDRVALLLDGEATSQAYVVMESTVPPGGGPPRHVHHREDELFLVLEGEVTFFIGDTTVTHTKGESIVAPKGVPHRFKNTGAAEATMLITAMPAGIEKFFEAAGHPLPDRTSPPVPPTRADIEHMIAIAPTFGIDILIPKEKS